MKIPFLMRKYFDHIWLPVCRNRCCSIVIIDVIVFVVIDDVKNSFLKFINLSYANYSIWALIIMYKPVMQLLFLLVAMELRIILLKIFSHESCKVNAVDTIGIWYHFRNRKISKSSKWQNF